MNDAMNTTDEATLREEFERWAKEEPRDFDITIQGPRAAWPGQYNDYRVECSWQAYLAASRSRKWQPIDSAPKDGTEVIGALKFQEGYAYVQIQYDEDYPGWFDFDMNQLPVQPTHWQPLPPTPTPESNEG